MTITDWLTALGTIALAVLALTAWQTAIRTLNQMREDSQEKREDSARATRPYVHVELVPSLHHGPAWDLVLANTGRTTARELRVTVDGDPYPSDQVGEVLEGALHRTFLLVPGARLRMMWRREGSEANKIEPTGMPLKVTLRVAYADDAGETYGDQFDLDLEGVGRAVPMAATGEAIQGRDYDLRNVRLGIDALSKHVGELRR